MAASFKDGSSVHVRTRQGALPCRSLVRSCALHKQLVLIHVLLITSICDRGKQGLSDEPGALLRSKFQDRERPFDRLSHHQIAHQLQLAWRDPDVAAA